MPTELAESQIAFLRGKYEAAQAVIDESVGLIPDAEAIFGSVDRGFTKIEENKRLYEIALDQAPESETARELYEEFLGAIGLVASELQVLEMELVYLDLHNYQQGMPTVELLDHAEDLSAELKAAFAIDITTIPVIWDGFAIDPLDENLPATGDTSRIYAVILPRMKGQPEQYAPFIGHELGHAVLDRHQDLEMQFYSEIRRVQRRTRMEVSDEDHFVTSWRYWFEELFCDACGVLTFGPAYLSALVWHLLDSNPYYIERDTGEDLHPPAALRYELTTDLIHDLCPEIADSVADTLTVFDQHLDALTHARPSDYDAYDYDELREFVRYEVPDVVTHELEDLVEDIRNNIHPDEHPDRYHRLASNRYWLDSYSP